MDTPVSPTSATPPTSVVPPAQPAAAAICPQCHQPVKETDYFCSNCGKEIHAKPISISIFTQILLYVGSIILAPLGIVWGFRYLRQPSSQAKMVGIVCILLTLGTLVVVTMYGIDYVNQLNEQVTKQMNDIQGF